MRCVIAFLLLSKTLVAQDLLPGFDSELIENVWIDPDLKGDPIEYVIKSHTFDKDQSRLVRSDIKLHYYLEAGQVRLVEFKRKGKVIKAHQFDRFGRITQQKRYDDRDNISRILYDYDEKLRQTSETVIKPGGQVYSKNLLRYNENYQLIAKEEYLGDSRLNRLWKYGYNKHQDLVSDEYYDVPDGMDQKELNSRPVSNSMRFKHTYDELQRKISSHNYTNQALVSKSTFEYYPDSAVSVTTFFRFDGLPNEQHLNIEMDSLKVLVKGFFFNGDTTKFRSRFREVYLYDDLIEYESRTIRGTYVDRYATFYEYDEMGNWIKKTTYSNGVVVKLQERTIEY